MRTLSHELQASLTVLQVLEILRKGNEGFVGNLEDNHNLLSQCIDCNGAKLGHLTGLLERIGSAIKEVGAGKCDLQSAPVSFQQN